MTAPELEPFTRDEIAASRVTDYIKLIGCLHDVAKMDGGVRALSNPLDLRRALDLHASRYPRGVNAITLRKAVDELHYKANVTPGLTSDAGWASALATVKPFTDAFIAASRPASLVGKLLANGARRVP